MSLPTVRFSLLRWTVHAHFLVAFWFLSLFDIAPLSAQSQVLGYEFASWPSRVTVGVPFPVQIRAVHEGTELGLPLSPLTFTANRLGDIPLILSEVRPDMIELTSTGTRPADYSGWQIQLIPTDPSRPMRRLKLPSGTILPAGGILTWGTRFVASGIHFQSDRPFEQALEGLDAILLRNNRLEVVDTLAVARNPSIGSWTGPPVPLIWQFYSSLSRKEAMRSPSSNAWTVAQKSEGKLNPSLKLPWPEERTPVSVQPEKIFMNQDVWNGFLTLHQTGLVYVSAYHASGRGADAPPIQVDPTKSMTLSAPPTALNRSEAHPGLIEGVEVVLEKALPTLVRLSLASSAPSEIACPSELIIAAGQLRIGIPLTNYDDTLDDGAALVRLKVSSPELGTAELEFVNADNESGQAALIVPPRFLENTGPSETRAQILLPHPALHDIPVELTVDAPLEAPHRVVIPQGSASAEIALSAEDNDTLNKSPFVHVRASISGWQAVEEPIEFADDEDPSLEILGPDRFFEGKTNWLEIRLAAPREAESVLHLTSEFKTSWVERTLRIPPGTNLLRIPLEIPDNTASNPPGSMSLRAETAEGYRANKTIVLYDDEVNLTHLQVYCPDLTARSDQPFRVRIQALGPDDALQYTNLIVHLHLKVPPQLARIDPEFQTLQLTNGEWSGYIVLRGEAESVQLVVEGAGLRSESLSLSVTDYAELSVNAVNIAVNPVTHHLLVLERPAGEDDYGQLVEIDPVSGLRLNSLALEQPATQLVVAPDGNSAWIHSAWSVLQRVDLVRWTLDRQVWLEDGASPLKLIVLPGVPERLVVSQQYPGGPTRRAQYELYLIEDSQLTGVWHRAGVQDLLAAGPDQFFVVDADQGVQRFRLAQRQFVVEATNAKTSGSLSTDGTFLYAGPYVLEPKTLNLQHTLEIPFPVVPFPEQHVLTSIVGEWGNSLTVYSTRDWQWLGTTTFADGYMGSPYSQRVLRWGANGLAQLSEDGLRLVLHTLPHLEPPPSDLQLTFRGPAIVNSTSTIPWTSIIEVEWIFGITNLSNSRVPYVNLSSASFGKLQHFALNAGEGTEYRTTRSALSTAILSDRFRVQGSASDPNPDNNEVVATTETRFPLPPGIRHVPLKSLHLIASPDGTRLYAALASVPGRPEGVAEIIPATGNIVRILSGVTGPSRLAISPDGQYLYAQDGFHGLVRWKLASGLIDLQLSFQDFIKDFQCLNDASQGLVVALARKIIVYDGPKSRPLEYVIDPPYESRLAQVGSRLWLCSERIQELKVSASGIQAIGPSLRTQLEFLNNGVPGDGRRLYFAQNAFDLSTGLSTNFFGGVEIIPDPSKGLLYGYFYGSITRYSMETLERLGSVTIDQDLISYGAENMVRWGDRGFAFRSGQAIVLTEPNMVPQPGQTDLGVSIDADPDWLGSREFKHRIHVANHSGTGSTNARLELRYNGALLDGNWVVQGAPSVRGNGLCLIDLPELAPHSTVTLTLQGVARPGYSWLGASVIGSSLDPNPSDNETSFETNVPPSETDLTIEGFAFPKTVQAGDIVSSRVVVRNRGEFSAPKTQVHIRHGYLPLISAAPFVLRDECCGAYFLEVGDLQPGQSREMELRFQSIYPGFSSATLELTSQNSERNASDNLQQQFVRVVAPPSPSGLQPLFTSHVDYQWSEVRQQLVGSAPFSFPAIDLLDPRDFQIQQRWSLPAPARGIALSEDGNFAWVRLDDGKGLVRVNLNTGVLDRNLTFLTTNPFGGALAVRPGDADNVVVAEQIWNTSTIEIRSFRNGNSLPEVISLENWSNQEISLALTGDRIFVSTGNHLRELQWTQDGVREQRNWNAFTAPGRLSYAQERLVFSLGTILNLDKETLELASDTVISAVADPISGRIYFSSGRTLEALDASTLALKWGRDFSDMGSPIESILPMGAHGFLLRSDYTYGLPFVPSGPIEANLALQAYEPGLVAGTNVPIPLSFVITNAGIWNAGPMMVDLELSPGLVFADDGLPGDTNRASIQIKEGISQQTRHINLLASTEGPHFVRAQVSGQLPDPDPTNNRAEISFQVLAPPTFLVEDLAIQEGSASEVRSVRAALSHTVPWEVEVQYSVVSDPPHPANWNLGVSAGVFHFKSGERIAEAAIFRGDFEPEPDKTFKLQFASTQVHLSRMESTVTLLNDDVPTLLVQRTPVLEGNVITNRWVSVSLSSPSTLPVEVTYQWAGDSAQPGVDFVASSGIMRFPPGKTTISIPVTILGDRIREGTETFHLDFPRVLNALAPTSPEFLSLINDDLPDPRLYMLRRDSRHVVIQMENRPGAVVRFFVTRDLNSNTWEELNDPPISVGSIFVRYSFELEEGSLFFRVLAE